MNALIYAEFWLVEATNGAKTWSVDNIHDLPFVDAETAQAYCDKWHEEFPSIHYKIVRYMRVEEKEKVN